jgi:hypothetical protein
MAEGVQRRRLKCEKLMDNSLLFGGLNKAIKHKIIFPIN